MPEIIPEIIRLQDKPAWFRDLGLLFICACVPEVTECAPGRQGDRNPSLVREAQAACQQAGRGY